nr:MAG TPA_asm: hypothetical protein [Caudoviricetes sp.]
MTKVYGYLLYTLSLPVVYLCFFLFCIPKGVTKRYICLHLEYYL